jgi:hypothetical protein
MMPISQNFQCPYSCCLMYHNCVCFQCVVGVSRTRTCTELSRVMYIAAFTFGSFLSITLKIRPDSWWLSLLPYHLLHYRRHAQLHHLPKALMWGNLSNKFLIALVSSSLVSGCAWPVSKFNPITKEACFHRGLSTVLHYPSRASV